MSQLISTAFLIPPAVFIWLVLVGIWLSLRRAPMGPLIALVASLCLYATATPLLGGYLIERIEERAPLNADLSRAQAIVVLGGGLRRGGPDEKDWLDPDSLVRVVMGAEAYRRLNLPVAVTGAPRPGGTDSEAALMRAALDKDFSVPVTWVDGHARTTYENALFISRLLAPAHIDTVVVVTQAWHMPRALWAFEHVGLHPVPWPAPHQGYRIDRLDDFLPGPHGLSDSYTAFHELIGAAYYRLRY